METKVWISPPVDLTNLTHNEFIQLAHGNEPAFLIVYSKPWRELDVSATCLQCAARCIAVPCRFGMLDLDEHPRIQKKYNISQANRIMLREVAKNVCADFVGIWCDHLGTFVVVMAFVGIIICLTDRNKKTTNQNSLFRSRD
eukprot:sb/3474183/